MDKIGIKLANGEFYPILDAGEPAKKRLVVTTVNDGQRSVQIDLYRGEGPSVLNDDYMGSLVIESIAPAPAGTPDIRLELELDDEGTLLSSATSPDTGEEQSLRVSLESLGEEKKYEIPDFDLEEERTDSLPDEATSPEEGAGLLAAAAKVREDRERRASLLPYIAVALGVILLALAVWFLFLRPSGSTSAAPAAAKTAQVQPAPVPTPAATPASAASPTPPPAPAVAAAPAPSAPQGKELRYRLRWGDTLWDLAWVHYKDPWLYPRLAKANKIRNPDLIIAGTWIVIPPR